MTIAKIEKLETRESQFGPFTSAIIGGVSVSAFNRFHEEMKRFKVGDDVDFTYERKGKYDRISSISPASGAGPANSSGANSVPASGPSQPKLEPFPLSMKVSYAKDLLIGNTAGTAEEAVALVEDLITGFTQPFKPEGNVNPTQ